MVNILKVYVIGKLIMGDYHKYNSFIESISNELSCNESIIGINMLFL